MLLQISFKVRGQMISHAFHTHTSTRYAFYSCLRMFAENKPYTLVTDNNQHEVFLNDCVSVVIHLFLSDVSFYVSCPFNCFLAHPQLKQHIYFVLRLSSYSFVTSHGSQKNRSKRRNCKTKTKANSQKKSSNGETPCYSKKACSFLFVG